MACPGAIPKRVYVEFIEAKLRARPHAQLTHGSFLRMQFCRCGRSFAVLRAAECVLHEAQLREMSSLPIGTSCSCARTRPYWLCQAIHALAELSRPSSFQRFSQWPEQAYNCRCADCRGNCSAPR